MACKPCFLGGRTKRKVNETNDKALFAAGLYLCTQNFQPIYLYYSLKTLKHEENLPISCCAGSHAAGGNECKCRAYSADGGWLLHS
jgi:hypothetical protein